MTVMSGNLYRALKSANVTDDLAQKAAEEVAGHDTDIKDIKATLRLHSWMLGLIIAGTASLILKAFF
ncbi:hypothetical protein [Phyllobacterium leguminum]|uniref:DUF1640 domain-containing protein n=1 Tax=Phyllobacterium leguminum TaxID=314237 RepID=A0A318T3B5_9HYPH|nr:hypothetical protein [Phyllobacterium leguminum]PYE88525.1 hypothetical protein C7477_107168 [Phyllobacterium leguminum]